jgi:hypothetical protein
MVLQILRALFALFASGSERYLETEVPKADRPKNPNREGESPQGGKYTETGMIGTDNQQNQEHHCAAIAGKRVNCANHPPQA